MKDETHLLENALKERKQHLYTGINLKSKSD